MPSYRLLAAGAFAMFLSGCDLIAGIFKAGMWTGITVVIAVVALIVYGIVRLLR